MLIKGVAWGIRIYVVNSGLTGNANFADDNNSENGRWIDAELISVKDIDELETNTTNFIELLDEK